MCNIQNSLLLKLDCDNSRSVGLYLKRIPALCKTVYQLRLRVCSASCYAFRVSVSPFFLSSCLVMNFVRLWPQAFRRYKKNHTRYNAWKGQFGFFSVSVWPLTSDLSTIDGYRWTWSHSLKHNHSAGLLWTSDRPVAEASTWQYKTFTWDKTFITPAGFKPTVPASEWGKRFKFTQFKTILIVVVFVDLKACHVTVSDTHTHTHTHTQTYSVGLLWTSDRPVAETSTWQQTTSRPLSE